MAKRDSGTPIKCNNSYIQAMLVAYAERSLAKHNRAEVEKHLSECDCCREDLRHMQEVLPGLSELSKAGFLPESGDHPQAGELFSFAQEPESLTREQLRNLRVHVALCSQCQREIALIKNAEQEFQNRVDIDWMSWVLPPALRDLFAAENSQEDQEEETSFPVLPWQEQLTSLFQKFNLRTGLVVGGALLLLFCGLSFVMCGSDSKAPAASVATPSPSATVADVLLVVGTERFEEVRQLLDNNNLPFTVEGSDRISLPAKYAKQAQTLLQKAGIVIENIPAAQASPSASPSLEPEYSPEASGDSQSYTVESDSAVYPEADKASPEPTSLETPPQSAEPDESAAMPEPRTAEESPPPQEKKVASAPAPAPKPQEAAPAAPRQVYSQPHVTSPAVSSRRYTAVRSQPRPARTPEKVYRHSSTNSVAPAPRSAVSPSSSSAGKSDVSPAYPVPITMPRLTGGSSSPAAIREAHPTPAIIRPAFEGTAAGSDSNNTHRAGDSPTAPDVIDSKETVE